MIFPIYLEFGIFEAILLRADSITNFCKLNFSLNDYDFEGNNFE